MFETILIANRGEIASRIIRTCRRLGVRSVAVYSEADRSAPFVRLADEAHLLGPAAPRESYLHVERLLAIAQRADAQAVHPGYGFLAENAEFAEACAARDLTFIGPPPSAIRAMGLKHEAKQRMAEAGVRVLPGYLGEDQSPARLARAAAEVGYPILIKAVAGGGGKGMRRVDAPDELAPKLEAAQREALAAFGDARVLIEKYLERPRHIEVQVFGDRLGNVVHLFSRDCSTQRRHQKLLEEAPPPGITEPFEATIHDLAVRAARAIHYEGAGTVELIADVAHGLSEERVYFMEMNTRLQVEHPVTELITGLDLVEWQLRVASGEPLPRMQSELERRGHAIEVRLYAEDPDREYMPQQGTVVHFRPPSGEHVRVDASIEAGGEVGGYYDALLAKLIVWGDDRAAAVRRLRSALGQFEVAGLVTNLALLNAVAAHPAFAEGDVHTGLLEQHRDALFTRSPGVEERLWVLACVGRLESRARARDLSPWSQTRAFRVHGPHRDVLEFAHGEVRREVEVTFARTGYELCLDERVLCVREPGLERARVHCECDGEQIAGLYLEQGPRAFVLYQGYALETRPFPSPLEAGDESEGSNAIKAPMPGRVHALLVGEGVYVERGQPLLSLEAMKMEHTLRAPRAGKVTSLSAEVGQQVEEGRTLLVLSTSEET